MSSLTGPLGGDAFANARLAPDLHDRVTEAYYGKKGEEFGQVTRDRIHWICAHVLGKRVLDVGCSQGITAILLGREGRSVIGIDVSQRSIEEARGHLSREPSWIQANVEFWNGDFLSSGLGSKTFETIIFGEILEHLTRPDAFIDAAATMLAEDGRIIVTVPFGINDWPNHKQTFYLLEPWRLLSRHFDIEEVKVVGGWIGFIGRRRSGNRATGDALPRADILAMCEAAFQEIERAATDKCSALTRELKALQSKFDDFGDETQALKDRATQAEAARHEAERERDTLLRKLKDVEHTLESSRADVGDSKRELEEARAALKSRTAEHDNQIRELREQLAQAQDASQIFDAELASRDARIATLQSSADALSEALEKERSANAEAIDKRRGVEEFAEALSERLIGVLEGLRTRSEEIAALRAEADRLRAQGIAMPHEVALLSSERTAAKRDADSFRKQLNAAMQQVEAEKAQYQAAKNQLEVAKKQIEVATNKVQADQQQVRKLTGDLEEARKAAAAERSANETLKRQLQEATSRTMILRTQFDSLQNQKALADARVEKIKQTISFQLGYALLHSGQSWRTTVELPGTIVRLLREGRKREQDKQTRLNASATPVSILPAAAAFALTLPDQQQLQRRSFSLTEVAQVKELRIACIMDEFSYACFSGEASFHQLSPDSWLSELTAIRPDILLIESAWRGKDDLWRNRVDRKSEELIGIINWCNAEGIPTAFWNKEDPVHFETFLSTAALFDFVFTTDLDCIPRYKATLRHDRVYLLPFACQATRFNPIETCERSEAVCFAGAYYARYPERNRDLEAFVSAIAGKRSVEIFDRNYGNDDARYKFPDDFAPFIIGHVPFDQIDRAYKSYHYAINMNSVKQSQSMFARRVFELLACNTIIASNFSRGLRLFFGDLVVCSDNGEEIVSRLDHIGDGMKRRKFKLLGLRKVMAEHTAEDRLAYVVSKIESKPARPLLPAILVTGYARSKSDFDCIVDHYSRQTYARKSLVIVAPAGVAIPYNGKDEAMRLVTEDSLTETTMGQLAGKVARIVGMTPEDYYGPNYLMDLALATRYTDAPLIGKGSHYILREGGEPELTGEGQQYSRVPNLPIRCAMVGVELIRDLSALRWMSGIRSEAISASDVFSIDEFNYCRNGARAEAESLRFVNDIEGVDVGASMDDLIRIAENVCPELPGFDDRASLTGAQFAKWFSSPKHSGLGFHVAGSDLGITSTLESGKHEYVYASSHFRPHELGFDRTAKLHLEVTPGLNVQLALLFLDERKQRISHQMIAANSNATCTVPPTAAFVRIGIRIYGPGHAQIRRFVKGHAILSRGVFVSNARHLILTNLYPQYDDLYRNGFVHSRVRAYKQRGLSVDVFRFRPNLAPGFHEFQGVDVMTGSSEVLERVLTDHTYESIAVHFLDEGMWRVLERQCSKTRIIVWLHGSEVQPWWRRADSYRTENEREIAKSASHKRIAFWRSLMTTLPHNVHFVFVSEYFAREVMGDVGVTIPSDRFSVIHNSIDTSLFEYRPKNAEMRKKILSIRPFASRKYANDLTCAAILALESHRFFNEMEFRIIGDGPLFDETVGPLRKLDNVVLEKRFLTQREIADIHAQYGIFLVPTRMDSQGVSRDEAMSSGLVPITTSVAAIPEFVDSDCGRLVPAEDAEGLARAIVELYEHPETFLNLSAAAAARIRRQSDAKLVIERELSLLVRGFENLPLH